MSAIVEKVKEHKGKLTAVGVSGLLSLLGGHEFMKWREQCRSDHEEFRYMQFCVEFDVPYHPGDLRRD